MIQSDDDLGTLYFIVAHRNGHVVIFHKVRKAYFKMDLSNLLCGSLKANANNCISLQQWRSEDSCDWTNASYFFYKSYSLSCKEVDIGNIIT